jgi:hypothetical protein
MALVQEYQDGVLIREYDDGTPEPEPVPVAPDDLIAGIAAMTDTQKADLRAALGL